MTGRSARSSCGPRRRRPAPGRRCRWPTWIAAGRSPAADRPRRCRWAPVPHPRRRRRRGRAGRDPLGARSPGHALRRVRGQPGAAADRGPPVDRRSRQLPGDHPHRLVAVDARRLGADRRRVGGAGLLRGPVPRPPRQPERLGSGVRLHATPRSTDVVPLPVRCTAAGAAVFRDVNCSAAHDIKYAYSYLTTPVAADLLEHAFP